MTKRLNRSLPVVLVTVLLSVTLLFLNHPSLIAKNVHGEDGLHGVKPTKIYAHLQWDRHAQKEKAKTKNKNKDKEKEIISG